jgi:hypothetical protein
MANFFNCVGRLNQAAGRTLSNDEVTKIFEATHRAALDLKAGRRTAAQIKTGQGAAIDQVVQQVAAEAAKQYAATALRKQRNAALQAVKLAQRADDVKAMVQAGLTPLDALGRLIGNRADGRGNKFSLEAHYLGVVADMKRRLNDTWSALGNDFLGFLQNDEKVKLLIREMRGENTGDAMAKKGADAWRQMTEEFRKRYNDSGGDIGKLDDWGLPQHHSQELVARAGRDTWINAVMPALDRTRYVDDLGVQWNDAKMRDFLDHAWNTIATNGYANLKPGEYKGGGAVSSRHAEQRQIHFANADALINYWRQFGERTFPQVIDGHVESMARDLAFLEHFGPNADASYRTLRDQGVKDQAKAAPTKLGSVEKDAAGVDALWNTASGKTIPVADRRIANFFDNMRNINVAAKLGSAFWSSVFGDKVMLETMSHLNGLPAMQRWGNEMRMLSPVNGRERAMLQRQGLMLEYMTTAMARFGGDLGKSSLTGKLANGIMRVSGMNAINEWRRGAFGLSLMDGLGREVATKDFARLDPDAMHLLTSYGINAHDWSVWKLAQLEDYGHGNNKMLTPDAIAAIPDAALRQANIIGQTDGPLVAQRVRQGAITKLLGAISSESRLAVVEPGFRERAQLYANLQRGTIKGELMRAFWQFKAMPVAQFERIWDVAMSRPSFGGKIGVLSAVMAMQVLAGAMMTQTREVLAGKDPRPMDWKFGLASFISGGSLGVYGDFIYNLTQTRQGTGPLELFAGPTVGPVLDALTSTAKAVQDAQEGKETHLLAKYLTLGKGFVPGSNLWYTKAATDHLIFQRIQELLSPGYLASMRARTMKDFGQGWWWEPGSPVPQRPPDLSTMKPK